MNTQILAISGKLQSGKNTVANYILGQYMKSLSLIRGDFHITPQGKLYVEDLWGNNKFAGVFELDRQEPDFLHRYIYPYIKLYSFADPLKQFCIKVLGLTYEQCYGTDEQKNTFTHLKWRDMPAGIPKEQWSKIEQGTLKHNYMTGREVMQYFGSNIIRKMYDKAWVRSTLLTIEQDNPCLAIIYDCRFPNEVEGVQEAQGKVLRLTRQVNKDEHVSETLLDKDKYDWSKFDYVLNNDNMSIEEQNTCVLNKVTEWGYLP